MLNKFYLLIVFLFLFSLAGFSSEAGNIEFHDYLFDYSSLSVSNLEAEADSLVQEAFSEKDLSERNKKLHKAMRNYHILLKISPNMVNYMNKRALIYDALGKDMLAKSYFARSLNLDKDNSETNFLVGDFFYKRRDFKRALRYFSDANRNGCNNFDINYKLGIVSEKLGDLEQAKKYYSNAYNIDNSQEFLLKKIESLKDLKP